MTQTRPIAVGDRVTVVPGTTWANKRLNVTHVYRVLEITDERDTTGDDDDVVIVIGRENEISAAGSAAQVFLHPRQVTPAHDLMGQRVRDNRHPHNGLVIAVWPRLGTVAIYVTEPDGQTWTTGGHIEDLTVLETGE